MEAKKLDDGRIEVEMPRFTVGEKIPLKGHWYIVDSVGLTGSGEPGLVLSIVGLTAKEIKHRKRREERFGLKHSDDRVAEPKVGVGEEEGPSSGEVGGTQAAPDIPGLSETETIPLAGSDSSAEGSEDLEQPK